MNSTLDKINIRAANPQVLQRSARLAWLISVWILSIPPGLCLEKQWEGFPVPHSEEPVVIERFQYDMRGSVRLLFFWIGKSGVGGGWISRIRSVGDQSGPRFDGWEVLFGSKPEAVPGGHNRWGYARELAFWGQAEDSSLPPTLEKTVFQGFMTLSSEDSLSEVRKGKGGGETAFEGTESSVHPDYASVEMRRFISDSNESFENPSGIGRQYLSIKRHSPPDETRTLTPPPSTYFIPYGFLTVVNSFLSDVIGAAHNSELRQQLKNQERSYIYNAKYYSLKIKRIKYHDEVELGKNLRLEKIFEVDFEAKRKGHRSGHSFAVWISSTGALAGIPIKIVDKPRWWLKVELTLKDFSSTRTVIRPGVH